MKTTEELKALLYKNESVAKPEDLVRFYKNQKYKKKKN